MVCSMLGVFARTFQHFRHSTHHNRNQISTFHSLPFNSLFNRCFVASKTYPENSQFYVLYCHIKLEFLLTVYVIGSCLRTLAVILAPFVF